LVGRVSVTRWRHHGVCRPALLYLVWPSASSLLILQCSQCIPLRSFRYLPIFIQRSFTCIRKFSWNSPVPYLSLREDTPSLTLLLEKSMNRIQQKCPTF
jgi:hypothetical protein